MEVREDPVDFNDSEEDTNFRLEARAFLKEHARPLTGGQPRPQLAARGPSDLPEARRLQSQLAAHRLAAITWPPEYGGRGGTVLQHLIFAEEAARFDMASDMFICGLNLAGPTIVAHGTDQQKARYLPRILNGDEVWCQLFSEPGAGSDLAGLRTRAERDGDDWLVNGQKVWSSGAHFSDWGILVARSDPSQPKHRGITYFLLDIHSPGVTTRPLRQMTGDAHFAEVFLDDVRVTDAHRLGDVNDGWAVIQTTLMNERLMIAGGFLEIYPETLISYAQTTGSSGRESAVRQGLADLYIRSRLMQFIRYRLMTSLATGEAPGPAGSIAKLATADFVRRTGDISLSLLGPAGALIDGDSPMEGVLQAAFLAGPSIRIAGGSDEIQRNIVGERILGLPREPDSSRQAPSLLIDTRVRLIGAGSARAGA
jgi:alkylation response protein AidB-like acyl-CoA dehydrogenase